MKHLLSSFFTNILKTNQKESRMSNVLIIRNRMTIINMFFFVMFRYQ